MQGIPAMDCPQEVLWSMDQPIINVLKKIERIEPWKAKHL